MVIANVLNTYTTASGLWQYDYGQILRIQNLKLPHAVEIHFSLQEKGGESVTRVGTTRDNVTDVVIPDSMLENGATTADYKIYAFIYLTDSQSGQTEYKISMSVKSRPRPEQFEKQEDGELFRKAISEVNKSADSALQSKKEAEAWAHGHESYPDRDQDNAKYYANQAKDEAQKIPDKVVDGKNVIDQYVEEQKSSLKTDFEDILAEGRKSATSAEESATKAKTAKDESVAAAKEAKQSAEDANTSAQASKESASTASSASDTANSAKEIAVSAANSADSNALAASKSAQEAKQSAEQADTAAKSANESKQAIEQLKTAIDTTAEQIATDRTAVETDKKEVQKAKSAVEDLKGAIEQKSSEAITNIGTVKDSAISDVNTAKDTAVSAITQEKESAVNAVNDSKDAVVADINKNENVQQIQKNKDSVEELKKDVDQLNDKKITKFYANNLGETYLQDSDNGKIQDMVLYGKSEQKLYNGYNLFDKDNVLIKNIYVSNSKLRRGWPGIESFVIPCKPNTTYTVSRTKVINKNFIAFSYDGEDVNDKEVISVSNSTGLSVILTTGENDTLIGLYYAWDEDKKADEIAPTIMIEEGSENHPYEPYVGGIPSPNIEYPQEIKSVVNPAIKICGKNLLNLQRMIPFYNSVYLGKINILSETVIEAEKITDSTNSRFYAATLNLSNGNYVASVKQNSTYNFLNISQYPKKPSAISQRIGTSSTYGKAVAFSVTDDYDYVLEIRTGSATENPDNGNGKTIFTVQIEKGSSATDYDPYKGNTAVLPYTLNAIPVSSDGNITIDGQQYIADYVDVERGKLVRNVREVDFSTCTREKDYYNILDNSKEVRYSYNNLKIKQQQKGAIYNNGGGFINAFTLIPSTTWNNDQIGISSHAQGNNNRLSIRIPVEKELNDLFDEIGGCKGLFEIDTPEEIDLTQEEIEAFKELATYYPVTNVSVASDQLDGYTTFNYPISMKNGWDYVKQQLNDNRDYIYDMDVKTQDIDTQSAEAYVNSEYAVALTELEVM